MLDFGNIAHRQTEPGPGKLLISDPFLPDPNFNRTVVLLTEHQHRVGSVGFVLNRPAGTKLQDVVDFNVPVDIPLYNGGPVQPDTLHLIHKDSSLGEADMEVMKQVYWGANYEALKLMLENNELDPRKYRFFLGYSGWGEDQLENELEHKNWIVSPANQEIIFSENAEQMWQAVMKAMGGRYSFLANSPENPQWN